MSILMYYVNNDVKSILLYTVYRKLTVNFNVKLQWKSLLKYIEMVIHGYLTHSHLAVSCGTT